MSALQDGQYCTYRFPILIPNTMNQNDELEAIKSAFFKSDTLNNNRILSASLTRLDAYDYEMSSEQHLFEQYKQAIPFYKSMNIIDRFRLVSALIGKKEYREAINIINGSQFTGSFLTATMLAVRGEKHDLDLDLVNALLEQGLDLTACLEPILNSAARFDKVGIFDLYRHAPTSPSVMDRVITFAIQSKSIKIIGLALKEGLFSVSEKHLDTVSKGAPEVGVLHADINLAKQYRERLGDEARAIESKLRLTKKALKPHTHHSSVSNLAL